MVNQYKYRVYGSENGTTLLERINLKNNRSRFLIIHGNDEKKDRVIQSMRKTPLLFSEMYIMDDAASYQESAKRAVEFMEDITNYYFGNFQG